MGFARKLKQIEQSEYTPFSQKSKHGNSYILSFSQNSILAAWGFRFNVCAKRLTGRLCNPPCPEGRPAGCSRGDYSDNHLLYQEKHSREPT